MTLLDKYLNGQTREVYDELYLLEEKALNPSYFTQTNLVLKETFRRVKINLDIIYNELKNINYRFASDIEYDWQKPITSPSLNVDELITALRAKTKKAGHIPLSLEYFYHAVGSCNFCWDWETDSNIPWEGADPIDIPPIESVIDDLFYDGYEEEDILLSGDYLQKDNISGSGYNIELTKAPCVDSLLLHEDWNIPFIEYLRITFDNCGFSRAEHYDYKSLRSFCSEVKPKLLKI